MKPAWDQLGSEYEHSSSVVIADVDCTVESDLCQKHGVKGYPTIKYYTAETGKDGESYSGGRGFDQLKTFVEDTLEVKCLVASPEGCSEKEVEFMGKMKAKGADDIEKQHTRLQGMAGKSMTPDLKKWLFQRINILAQLKEQ